jgi:hypothetical protein
LHSVLYKKKQNLTGYIQYYKKMVGQTQSPWVRQNPSSCLTQCQTEKKVFANSVIPNVWYNSYLRFCPKGIDQCLILFLNYIIFIVFTPFIHFRFQPNPFVKTITTRLVICIYISQWHDVFHTTIDL